MIGKPLRYICLPIEEIKTDKENQSRSASDFEHRVKKVIEQFQDKKRQEVPIRICKNTFGRWVVLDGHSRLAAMSALGYDKINCAVMSENPDDMEELRMIEFRNNVRQGCTKSGAEYIELLYQYSKKLKIAGDKTPQASAGKEFGIGPGTAKNLLSLRKQAIELKLWYEECVTVDNTQADIQELIIRAKRASTQEEAEESEESTSEEQEEVPVTVTRKPKKAKQVADQPTFIYVALSDGGEGFRVPWRDTYPKIPHALKDLASLVSGALASKYSD